MYNMSKGIKGIVDLLNAKGVEVTDENVAKVNAFVDELGTKEASEEEDASVESVEEVSVGSEEVDSIFGSLPKYLPKTKITPFGVKDINEHIEAVGTVFDTLKETLKSKQEELKKESEQRAKKANATKEDDVEEDVEDDALVEEEATQVTEYVRVSHTSLKDGILTVNVYENNNGDEEEKEYTLGYNKETEQFEPLALGSEELEELEELDELDEPDELEEPETKL